MKVILCVIGALLLLSSITSIFNNLVVEDASAQQFENVAASMYNGYENSVPPVHANNPNEYSSYNNYQPLNMVKQIPQVTMKGIPIWITVFIQQKITNTSVKQVPLKDSL